MGGGGEDCDPWALECVRVRPNASGHEFAERCINHNRKISCEAN